MTRATEAFERAVDAFNRHDLDRYFELYGRAAILHGYAPRPLDFDRARSFYSVMLTTFPDARVTIDDCVEQGDRLAVRYTLSGTHRGDFMGVPATGRPIQIAIQTFLRFADGKVVERWQSADLFGLMTQIGAAPPRGDAR